MSKPPLNPTKTAAGIAVDPHTLERVIPESRRPDGTVRKQIKIRPGFTPQEDVSRFRGTRQTQMDANALPKGHIVGWAPPPSSNASSATGKPMSKSAKKNAKRKEKRKEAGEEAIRDNWEDDDDETEAQKQKDTPVAGSKEEETPLKIGTQPEDKAGIPSAHTSETLSKAKASDELKSSSVLLSTSNANTAPPPTNKPTNPLPRNTARPPRGPPNTGGLAGKLAAELNRLNIRS